MFLCCNTQREIIYVPSPYISTVSTIGYQVDHKIEMLPIRLIIVCIWNVKLKRPV